MRRMVVALCDPETERFRLRVKWELGASPAQTLDRLLDELTKVRAGDDVTIEVLDAEFGDAVEAERMPLASIEYDEHADEASVGVGGRDGRYPVVLRHSIGRPTSIQTDSKAPRLPLVVQIVGADGSETLVTVLPGR
jgi:Family of unknown function (DUF5335)